MRLQTRIGGSVAAAVALWSLQPSCEAQGLPFGFPTPPGASVAVAVAPAGSASLSRLPGSSPASQSIPGAVAVPQAFEVVPLKYADVSEVVGLLTADQTVKPNDSFTPEEPAFGSPSAQTSYASAPTLPTGFSAGGASAAPAESLGQTVDEAVGVDRRLNAIILKGSPEHVAQLRALIAKIDVPVASVSLETVFVELTQTGAKNIGIDFTNASNQIGTVSYGLAAGGSTLTDVGAAVGGGLAFNLQAAIYGQVAKGNGRIVSKPRIAAQNGSTAKIITGDALPILTSIALSGVNAVQQQVQYVNVGVTLQIAPRLTPDGYVTSHIFAEVSSVTGYSQGYPTISQREATTSSTVKDGQSFVIGGLSQESRLSQHGKVPALGDLPLLGGLFRVQNTSSAKTDLYIVVTPHVLHGSEPLTRDTKAAIP